MRRLFARDPFGLRRAVYADPAAAREAPGAAFRSENGSAVRDERAAARDGSAVRENAAARDDYAVHRDDAAAPRDARAGNNAGDAAAPRDGAVRGDAAAPRGDVHRDDAAARRGDDAAHFDRAVRSEETAVCREDAALPRDACAAAVPRDAAFDAAVHRPIAGQRERASTRAPLEAPSRSVRAWIAAAGVAPTAQDVDVAALCAYIDGRDEPTRTFLRAARQLPPHHALCRDDRGDLVVVDEAGGAPFWSRAQPSSQSGAHLLRLLRDAVERAVHGGHTAVALSGGLDSAIVLALARALAPSTPAYILAPAWRDYAETDAALATAARFGGNAVVVDVGEAEFRAALPAAVAAFEVPIYNAHPVAKLLLAQRLQRDGVTRVVTGDGADHVMRRDRSADYLPLVQAAHDACGVELCAPFLDDAVVAHLLRLPPDPDKRVVRDAGAALDVAPSLVRGPKRSRLAPPIRVRDLVPPAKLARLASFLGRAPPGAPGDDPRDMRWCTTSLLLDAFAIDL